MPDPAANESPNQDDIALADVLDQLLDAAVDPSDDWTDDAGERTQRLASAMADRTAGWNRRR